jgi:osmoprotectant transport system permease protein
VRRGLQVMWRWMLSSSLILVCGFGFGFAGQAWGESAPIRVASKNFTESYVLAEIASQVLEARGFAVERRFGLGGTLICFEALANDEIDLYVEYTGTLSQAILDLPLDTTQAQLNASLAPRGLELLPPFGFNNTYAMAVRRSVAERLGLASIGDLRGQAELKVVVSHEFLERGDGWPGLAAAYGLSGPITGIEHGLAYQALQDGAIDVTDAYSTDGEVKRYDLVLLEDDKGFFPRYLALPLVRQNLPAPARQALASLADTLSDAQMQALNAEVAFEGRTFAQVASSFLAERNLLPASAQRASAQAADSDSMWSDPLWSDLRRNTLQHLKLTGIAMLGAVVFGVGLSLAVFRVAALSRVVLYVSGLMQTIPSIALLALMIPVLGIGPQPAIVALFLYSLLPILRNSITALTTLDPTLTRVAMAMGLSNVQQLRYVYVPLSLPSMLAGIRTAAVISIGTATLAAFIGAGGLGDPIVTGLALNDVGLILQGAIPAAALAVVTELLFEVIERVVLPGHLRGS